jgi:O-acetyl-ADP-ribose deacetylase (regulator of RNase III)
MNKNNLIEINFFCDSIINSNSDIIVNSANRFLIKGSGVCGIIHKAAGIELDKELDEIKKEENITKINIGDVIITKGYNLKSKFIFHTLGPNINKKENYNLLYNVYYNCLKKADELKQTSISFPFISCGIYGLNPEISAKIIKKVLNDISLKFIKQINFYSINREIINIHKNKLNKK